MSPISNIYRKDIIMKTIKYSILALATLFVGAFTSCSNDEIPIEVTSAVIQNALTVQINPQELYSSYTFEDNAHDITQLSEHYRTFFSEHDMCIEARVLLYDAQTEELVDSIKKFVSSSNRITATANLRPGTYYAVTILNFANANRSNSAAFHPRCNLRNFDRLSTCELVPTSYSERSPKTLDRWNIISTSTDMVTISPTQPTQLNVTTHPLGAIIYDYFQNFMYQSPTSGTVGDNQIRQLSLYARRRASSYNIDPHASSKFNYFSETSSNQWYYLQNFAPSYFDASWDYFRTNLVGWTYVLQDNVTLCFGYMKENSTGFTQVGEFTTTLTPGNTYLAYWDYLRSNSPYFGPATNDEWVSYTPISVSLYEEFPVVIGQSGATDVKNIMSNLGYTLESEETEETHFLMYGGKLLAENIFFVFSDEGKLNYILYYFDPEVASLNNLKTYVQSMGYTYYDTYDSEDPNISALTYYRKGDTSLYVAVYSRVLDGVTYNNVEYIDENYPVQARPMRLKAARSKAPLRIR